MKTKRFCLDRICNLYKDWDRLKRNELTASEKSISKFLKVLEKTCNLVGKNAIHEIKTDKCRDKKRKLEDETFVKDQVTTRIGKFWTSDSKYDSKINAKKVREEKYCPKTPKSRRRFLDRQPEVIPNRTRAKKNTVLLTCSDTEIETDENLNEGHLMIGKIMMALRKWKVLSEICYL